LSGLFTSPAFAAHELHEAVLPSVEAESAAAVADSVTHAIEVAHSLAFRSGLGYSLFAPPHSEFTPEDVKSFASKAFSSNNMAIVGTGIEESKLVKLVERHFASIAPSAMISSSASRYFGGDSRSNAHSHSPAAVFVGYGTTKASPELAVLAAHLNPTPSIKWSAGNSPLAPLSAAGASVHVVNAPFSDAALFGLVIQAPSPEGLTSASKAAVKALKDAGSGSLKGDDLTRAIARAKYWAAKSLEHRNTITNALGSQVCIPVRSR
jgi:ubiquinol-cytochrome c reductase core subunit 2